MWVCLGVLQDFDVLADGNSTIENTNLDIWHEMTETLVFISNLVSQFTSMAHNKYGCFTSDYLDLLKCCEDENGGFTETRFGLAKDICTKNRLGNTDLLNCSDRTEVRLSLQMYNDVRDREVRPSTQNTSTTQHPEFTDRSIGPIIAFEGAYRQPYTNAIRKVSNFESILEVSGHTALDASPTILPAIISPLLLEILALRIYLPSIRILYRASRDIPGPLVTC